jgi:SpoVK/Ycf46/Vps4 family AAA+-type ATPase
MSLNELAERLTALEQEVSELKKRLPAAPPNAWEETVGMFDGDELFAEAVREGRKYREQLRKTDTE